MADFTVHDSEAEEQNGEPLSWMDRWEELVDDYLYASRCGELDEVKTALFDMERHLASPHDCCSGIHGDSQTDIKEKDAPHDKPIGEAGMELEDDKQSGECPCQAMRRKKGPSIVDVTDPFTGQTALHMAAANGNQDVARFLIYDAGALHLPNRMGNTPLHWAVSNQKASLVKLLLDASLPSDSSLSSCDNRSTCPSCDSEETGETPQPHMRLTEQQDNLHSLHHCESGSPSNRETASSPVQDGESHLRSGVRCPSGICEGQQNRGRNSHFSVDVLAQNKMGKSALSEGFNSGNAEILQMLLEHHSAKQLEETYHSGAAAPPPPGEAAGGADGVCEGVSDTLSKKSSDAQCRGRSMLRRKETGQLVQNEVVMEPESQDNKACAAESAIAQEIVHTLRFGASRGQHSAEWTRNRVVEQRGAQRGPETGDAWVRSGERAGALLDNTEKREVEMEESGEPLSTSQRPDDTEIGEFSNGVGEITVQCREIGLAWCGEAFGVDAERDDMTGLHLWSAAVIAGQWMATLAREGLFAKADVLELGAGCGVMGLSSALHSSPPLASLTQTDIFPHTLRNLQKTQELNGLHQPAEAKSGEAAERQTPSSARVISLNWADSATWPQRAAAGEGFQQYDFLLGSDLIYDAEMVGPLVNVVAALLKRTGAFYYVHRLRRQGADLFIDALRQRGLKCEERSPPEEYFCNPFVDKTSAQAELLLPELFKERDFVMVKCAWR
ncbi:ankyrin repeat-containing protein [Cystoisospora suis]|uniref:Ankyrin repeat-containing protein n=1 Tax=Cystoisospora suis TaxID=483139 RepID=A0A2C6L8N9_9APIC|nr:ankyrin repeat-containing protein [Cystoisospora suis]